MKIAFVADIGGTNSNFAIVDLSNKIPKIIAKCRESTAKVNYFPKVVNSVMEKFSKEGYNPKVGCFAVAGPVKNDCAKMTHADFSVDKKEILKKTKLKKVLVINDFEAIGYAINVISPKQIKVLRKGKSVKYAPICVVGAGTGLGSCTLIYESSKDAYIPVASEFGHSDFPIICDEEFNMASFIKEKNNSNNQIKYEDLVSGKGIENIYSFLQATKHRKMPEGLSAAQISLSIKNNECSAESFDYFIKFYARCCRNFCLSMMSIGGLYVAGGIVAKNFDKFGDNFCKEFIKNETFVDILKDVPINLIIDYDISLVGCGKLLMIEGKF